VPTNLALLHGRITWLSRKILGLRPGDADIIRNAGSAVTEDTIRSLLVSTRVPGAREIMILNHTGCGMMTFKDEELYQKLANTIGTAAVTPASFHSFVDVDHNTREQIQKVKAHPWISHEVPVRGFVYEVETGAVHEVLA